MTRRRPAALLAALLCLPALGACGSSAGRSADVALRVTRDFGARPVGPQPAPRPAGGQTVLGLLERTDDVRGGRGGTPVRSVAGVPGPWVAYVNGLQIANPARRSLHAGDRVWWDRHAGGPSAAVGAVVGSYPEPFVHGIGGERWPTRVECPRGGDQGACRTVADRLGSSGVGAGLALIGTEGGEVLLRVVVGPWADVRSDRAAAAIEQGPRASGVFARFAAGGRRLQLLDAGGRVVRTVTRGGGLIAATRYLDEPPTWFVTGTDAAGVAAAAGAFGKAGLTRRFALATAGGRAVPLPVRPGAR